MSTSRGTPCICGVAWWGESDYTCALTCFWAAVVWNGDVAKKQSKVSKFEFMFVTIEKWVSAQGVILQGWTWECAYRGFCESQQEVFYSGAGRLAEAVSSIILRVICSNVRTCRLPYWPSIIIRPPRDSEYKGRYTYPNATRVSVVVLITSIHLSE